MVEAMKAAGFANYTLFRRGLDVIAVSECHPDVETCFARFAELGVGERWQASMAGLVARPDRRARRAPSATTRTGTLTEQPPPGSASSPATSRSSTSRCRRASGRSGRTSLRGYAELLAPRVRRRRRRHARVRRRRRPRQRAAARGAPGRRRLRPVDGGSAELCRACARRPRRAARRLERPHDRPAPGRADAGAGDDQLVPGRRGDARERARSTAAAVRDRHRRAGDPDGMRAADPHGPRRGRRIRACAARRCSASAPGFPATSTSSRARRSSPALACASMPLRWRS